ncbi:translation factor SUA5 [Hymenobacter daecheongensis DSM 21074]|uniref:Threonylcarbamoyl-AMP synthase n=1 Tax=Hymenobacter daecheongensis DSM 21074 TaxID=1121955 RepID=A0A1M6IYY4_9BACT|nr:L-threonylcarbamoyladenylate synthase [Hymenobacter daecheongensis]SHJ39582.1 translation factor SUA5 [Hymenobacter daecheongensis DSM 21074]
MTPISPELAQAARLLRADELVAIPTETVYGLAGNIFSPTAIAKIFALKQRPLFNPLIVHIHSIGQLPTLARHVPEKAQRLAAAFWPGPLTLVLKKQPSVPDLITAGKDTVAVRMPNHPLVLALLQQVGFPLAAPSANPFGSISPTRAAHVEEYFGATGLLVLDGGDCARGIESTIVGFDDDDEPVVYRLGSLALEEIEAVVGPVALNNKKETAPDAPGMLSRHYAPATPTHLTADPAAFIAPLADKKIGLLLFRRKLDAPFVKHQVVLSEAGDLGEAANGLYGALHALDKLQLDLIVAERMPDAGLGKSINDRLERATKTR